MNPQITPANAFPGQDAAAVAPTDAVAEAMAGLSGLDSAPTRSHVSSTSFSRWLESSTVRPPCFNIYQAYPEMIKGGLLADAVAIIGGLNVIAGELDR